MPTPKPVRHRDGTIVWRVRYRLQPGTNPVTDTFDDERSAARFASLVDKVGGEAARRALDVIAAQDDVTTVDDALAAHLGELAATVTPGTMRRYRQIARDRLSPTFGSLPVQMIDRAAVTSWLAAQRRTPMTRGQRIGQMPSAKTLREAQALLSAVLERLVRDGVIPSNPARGVRPPRDTISREKVFLTPSQFARLLEHVPAYYQPLVAVLYGTGLRFGEATALTPADVDLEAAQPVIHVTKAWKEGETGSYLGAPKTRRAVRTVTVPEPLVAVLRAQTEGKGGGDLLFPGPTGGQMESSSFHRLAWRPAVEAAGLDPAPRVHDLRHSHASALIAAGIPLPVIQRRLGHESIQTTVDVYGHLAPEAYAGAAQAAAVSLVQALPEIEG